MPSLMTKVYIQFHAKNPSIDGPASKSNIDLSDNAKKNSNSGKSSLQPVLYNGRSFRHVNGFLKPMLVSKVGDDLSWRLVVRWRSCTVRNFVFLNIYFARLDKTSSCNAEKIAGATIVVDGGLEL
jgi:hypothetical protein